MASNKSVLQLIGMIVLQSFPVGQQSTESLLLPIAIQVFPFPQQKFEGKLPPHCLRLASPPQTAFCLGNRPTARADLTALVRAVVDGTVDEMRHTIVSLRKVRFPMVTEC